MSGAASRHQSLILAATKYSAVDDRPGMHKLFHYHDGKTLEVLLATSAAASRALVPQYLSSGVYGDKVFWRVVSTAASTFRFTLHVQLNDETPENRFTDEDVIRLITPPHAPEVVRRFSLYTTSQVTDAILPALLALPFLNEFKVIGETQFSLAAHLAVVKAGIARRNWRLVETATMSLSQRVGSMGGSSGQLTEEMAQQQLTPMLETAKTILAVRTASDFPEILSSAILLSARLVEAVAPAIAASAAASACLRTIVEEVSDWGVYHPVRDVALFSVMLIRRVGRAATKLPSGGLFDSLVDSCLLVDTMLDLVLEKQGAHPCGSRRIREDAMNALEDDWVQNRLSSAQRSSLLSRLADTVEKIPFRALPVYEEKSKDDDDELFAEEVEAFFSFSIDETDDYADGNSSLYERLMAIKAAQSLLQKCVTQLQEAGAAGEVSEAHKEQQQRDATTALRIARPVIENELVLASKVNANGPLHALTLLKAVFSLAAFPFDSDLGAQFRAGVEKINRIRDKHREMKQQRRREQHNGSSSSDEDEDQDDDDDFYVDYAYRQLIQGAGGELSDEWGAWLRKCKPSHELE